MQALARPFQGLFGKEGTSLSSKNELEQPRIEVEAEGASDKRYTRYERYACLYYRHGDLKKRMKRMKNYGQKERSAVE